MKYFLNQSKFSKDLVSKFRLLESKPVNTPISTSEKITKDLDGIDIDPTKYRSIIGSLLYLTASRPDIVFSVGACSRYQATPKESHMKAATRVIRCVHGIINFGLWYPFDTHQYYLIFQMLIGKAMLMTIKEQVGNAFIQTIILSRSIVIKKIPYHYRQLRQNTLSLEVDTCNCYG